jgi:hypothetical protein
VTPLAVLSVTLLVAVVALVVDGGSLMEERRHIQAAADAAALAAASDLFANYPQNQGVDPLTTAIASARTIAAANGFSNDGVQSTVTVNVSPQLYQGGSQSGQSIPAGYVEVILQRNSDRVFSNLFGTGAVSIRARAVARGRWQPVSYALVALSLTIKPSGNTSGAKLGNQGDLWINSTAATPIADPLRSLPVPDPVQLGLPYQGSNRSFAGNSIINLYPGIYDGGISATGNATIILHSNLDGTPGIYYLTGGLSISGNATVTTAAGESGAMIYNNWLGTDGDADDGISVGGTGDLLISPPTSGPYQGVSIFQARGTTSKIAPQVNLGGGSINIPGTIYAPYANVYIGNHSSGGAIGQVISDTTTLVVNGSNSIGGTGPLANARTIGLVE